MQEICVLATEFQELQSAAVQWGGNVVHVRGKKKDAAKGKMKSHGRRRGHLTHPSFHCCCGSSMPEAHHCLWEMEVHEVHGCPLPLTSTYMNPACRWVPFLRR